MLLFATATGDASGTFLLVLVVLLLFIGLPLWYYFDGEKERQQKRERYKRHKEEAYRARQSHIRDWRKVRDEFDELRLTPEFRIWREEQYKCQDKKCAWCKKPIQCYSQYTHVDHIKPLFHGGTNSYWNLVLSCSYCNRRKGDWITGWTGEPFEVARYHTNRKPDWIKPNKHAYGVKLDGIENASNTGVDEPKTIVDQKSYNKDIADPTTAEKIESKNDSAPLSDTSSINQTSQLKAYKPVLNEAISKNKSASSSRKQPITTRRLSDKEQRYLLDIQEMLTDIRANKPKTIGNSHPNRPQYYFGSGYEGDEIDPDNPEYVADQYMSYDYDDWSDRYGPEW